MKALNEQSTKLREILESTYEKRKFDAYVRRQVKLSLSLTDLQKMIAKETDPYLYLRLCEAYVNLYKSFEED